jgi:hypothetical protein
VATTTALQNRHYWNGKAHKLYEGFASSATTVCDKQTWALVVQCEVMQCNADAFSIYCTALQLDAM